MSLIRRLGTKLAGLLACEGLRQLMSTLDYQALYYDRTVDPVREDYYGPAIYIFWHEYIPFPFYLRPHCGYAMLVSRHRDADILSEAARHMGYETVRGSTQRGGGAAIRELFRRGRTMNLVITPDGPRGPRRKLASGCIYLASRMRLPLVPFGLGYSHCWRAPTWDRFAVPRPFGLARALVGPRVWIPEDLDREGIEAHRQRIENVLNQLTQEAEQWAASGIARRGQVPMFSQSAPRHGRRAVTGDEANLMPHCAEEDGSSADPPDRSAAGGLNQVA